jgi:DNA-binding transcriptional LysR family regulator
VINLIEAARAGMGAALVPRCFLDAELNSNRLVVPVPTVLKNARGYFLCRRRARAAHPAADYFSDWLKRRAAS